MRKFREFTDEELYTIARQSILSTAEIMIGYDNDVKAIHLKLMQNVFKEIDWRKC